MTREGELTIRPAGPADLDAAGATVASGFMDEPVACWLFPDEPGRRQVGARVFRSMVEDAHANGEVLIGEDPRAPGQAAAVLLSLPMGDDESLAGGQDAFGRYAERMAIFAELTGERHQVFLKRTGERYPDRAGHLDLPCLAVLPRYRGTGIGNALMRHRLARADAAGLAAYGDATTLSWAQLLIDRHGFEPFGAELTLPGEPTTRLWPVWRQPKEKK